MIFPKGVKVIELSKFEPALLRDLLTLKSFEDLLTTINLFGFKDVLKIGNQYYLIAEDILYLWIDKDK